MRRARALCSSESRAATRSRSSQSSRQQIGMKSFSRYTSVCDIIMKGKGIKTGMDETTNGITLIQISELLQFKGSERRLVYSAGRGSFVGRPVYILLDDGTTID